MRRLDLDALALMDAIARAGSFSGAGVLMGKATSTISYAISKLESELGLTLFSREAQGIALTPAGRELIEQGRVLLQAADELEQRVKRIADGWEREIRIAVDSLIPPMMLGSLIGRFARENTQTSVRLISEAMTGPWEALVDGRADLIVASGPPPAVEGIRTRPLAALRFIFCVAPRHPLATWEGTIPSDELRRHCAVVASDSARRLPARTVGLLDGQRTLSVPDMRTKYALQVAGLGTGYLPMLFVESALARGVLVEKEVEERKEDADLMLAWRSGPRRALPEGRALQWWRDALSEEGLVPGLLARASHAWVSEY